MFFALFRTRFEAEASDIAQKGRWLVGGGDYVAKGIYFAINKKVAQHYSSSGSNHAIVLCRVCLTPYRSTSTLPERLCNLVGFNPDDLGEEMSPFLRTLEH